MAKRIVGILLLLALLGGTLATVVFYLGSWKQEVNRNPFAGVPTAVIRSYRFSDFAGQDLSSLDLKGTGPVFSTFTYDSSTKWPAPDKMPEGISPERILEMAKRKGLGIDQLHSQGITGSGVSVAVIDKPLRRSHQDLPSTIVYAGTAENKSQGGAGTSGQVSLHGMGSVSILAGKNGVAPGVRVYYVEIPDDQDPYARYAEAINRVLELNATLPEKERIRIILLGYPIDPNDVAAGQPSASDCRTAIEKAKKLGIIVVYPGMTDLQFSGAGCRPEKDRDIPENYEMWSWTAVKREVVIKLRQARADSFDSARKELIRLLTEDPNLDPLQAEAINTFIWFLESYRRSGTYDQWLSAMEGQVTGVLCVPADYLTVANGTDDSSYTYYGAGGLSWASAYLAGLLALGLQVKPDARAEELFAALRETATRLEWGGMLVNPPAFVQALR